jgi:hypothetical protein
MLRLQSVLPIITPMIVPCKRPLTRVNSRSSEATGRAGRLAVVRTSCDTLARMRTRIISKSNHRMWRNKLSGLQAAESITWLEGEWIWVTTPNDFPTVDNVGINSNDSLLPVSGWRYERRRRLLFNYFTGLTHTKRTFLSYETPSPQPDVTSSTQV